MNKMIEATQLKDEIDTTLKNIRETLLSILKTDESIRINKEALDNIRIKVRQNIIDAVDNETGKKLYSNAESRDIATMKELSNNDAYNTISEQLSGLEMKRKELSSNMDYFKFKFKRDEAMIELLKIMGVTKNE
jgi:Mg/Co/Ni transporter MgtE